VVAPVEVGVKRRMSESSTVVKPLRVNAVSKLMSSEPSACNSNASMSVLLSPMSEPSMNNVHAPVLMSLIRISSSANAIPPTVPEVLEPR